MWFSPLKGAHLTLGQLDKTLPVDKGVAANQKIQRGSFVYIKADDNGTAISPRFALYTSTEAAKPNAVPYIALMGVKDFQAGMAGNVGQAEAAIGADPLGVEDGVTGDPTGNDLTFLNKNGVAANPTYFGEQAGFVGPRITAISVVQPAEYQTTAFDATQSYYVGCPLTINDDGKLTPFTDGKNIVGYVTAVPTVRWINDLGASEDGARISGGNKKVIEFSTAWIPVAAVQTSGDGKTANVGALNVGGAKVEAAAGAKADAQAGAGAKAGDVKTPTK